MSVTPDVDALVVGAGIAGLAAAVELQARFPEVLVVDASERVGGVMRTEHVGGYLVERGPNTFLVKPPMAAFLEEHRLADALLRATPASRSRFLYRAGALVPVPLSPPALLRTPLLGARAKWRLLAEPFVRRGDPTGESVAEFAGRRLGPAVVDALIGPFLTGVYAGDERELGADGVFPALTDYERRSGSLALGAMGSALRRRRPRGLPGTHSSRGGLGPFARQLADRLAAPPALSTRVEAVHRDDGVWSATLLGPGGASEVRARNLVVATPAGDAARLLEKLAPVSADALGGISYAPVVTVSVGVDPADLATPVEGFGFLVPRGEALDLLGCLFMSRLFPERAPADRELLQCIAGGTRWPEAVDLDDDVLLERIGGALEQSLGLRGDARSLVVSRWPRAVPQPGRDHPARVAAARSQLAALPALAVAGSYLDGVGVPDALASGIAAARELSGDG